MIYFVIVLIAVFLFYLVGTYNKFVTTRTRIKASIQEIGNQLKRQANLIPGLADSVKGYLTHEKGIFTELTNARNLILSATKDNNPQALVDTSAEVERLFGRFNALMESTPELKGVEAVTKFMDEFRDSADKLMYSRRVLIDLSADFNVMVVTFPSNLIAKIFGFKTEKGLVTPESGEHLEVSEKETQTPKVDF
jgi:LemA protein